MEDLLSKWKEKIKDMTPEQQEVSFLNVISQNYQLSKALEAERDRSMFRRLDYLFEVIKAGTFTEEFTSKCKREIMEAITLPEVEVDNKQE